MPYYEYECESCGCRFDEQRPVADRHNIVCRECANPCRIVIGQVGIVAYPSRYNSALGAEITGPRQKRALLKERGLIDIGDAKPSDIPKPETQLEREMRHPKFERKIHKIYQFLEENRGRLSDAEKEMQIQSVNSES